MSKSTQQPTSLEPKDHAERVALFRMKVLGPLTCTELDHGEQAKLLRELSRKRFCPPGRPITRRYGVSTLERWLGRYRKGGLEALRPGSRATGHAKALTKAQRELIIEIRREYRGASVPLIMRTLIAEGRIEANAVTASAVRRLLASHGLQRELVARDVNFKNGRRRWQVERPGQLWHADVCHGPSLKIDGKTQSIKTSDIEDQSEPMSAMLPMATVLTKREIRDLISYLVSLKR